MPEVAWLLRVARGGRRRPLLDPNHRCYFLSFAGWVAGMEVIGKIGHVISSIRLSVLLR